MLTRFRKVSVIDYPGKISSVAFFGRCNYQCPSCHAKQVMQKRKEIPQEDFFDYLDSRKGLIDAVVLCGGEPTLHHDLEGFARKIKERGLLVKLDTNGSNYEIISSLIDRKLADYVALDIKGPPGLYNRLVGRNIDLRDDVEKAAGIVQYAPDFEFRTTLVPIPENEKFRWMTNREVKEMAEWINGFVFTNAKDIKWHLQKFVARTKGEMIDEKFSKENLPGEYNETPPEVMEERRREIIKYFPNCKVR